MAAVTRRRRSSESDPAEEKEAETRTSRRRQRSEETETYDHDDEDEPEKPARRRSKVKDEPRGKKSGRVAKSGWGGAEEAKEAAPAGGDYANELVLPEGETVLIKFPQDAPFDSYLQHWIDNRKGKRSFTCVEEDCPLDEIGDRPSVKVAFNVISLDDPEKPVLRLWTVGVQVADIIKEFVKDKKTSPINREDLYFAVKRTKKDKRWNTTVVPVKARDLDEDWDCDPLTEAEIEAFEPEFYDYTSTEDTPLKLLNEVADEIAGA